MPYLHEQRLAQARKSLYMLGNQGKAAKAAAGKKSAQQLEEALASGAGAGKTQSDNLKARQAVAAKENLEKAKFDKSAREETEDVSKFSDDDYKTYLNDVSVISGKGPRDFQGPAMPQGISWGPQDSIRSAQTQLKLNSAAVGAPIGGQFTKQGAEQNKAQADDLTDDFHTSDALMQQGSLMNQQADQALMIVPQGMMGTRPVRFGGY